MFESRSAGGLVPVPIETGLEKVGLEILAVGIADDVVDTAGHHDIITGKDAEIISAPCGIGGNPAKAGDKKLGPHMIFIQFAVHHHNMTGRDALGTKQGDEHGRIVTAVPGHGRHQVGNGMQARIHVPVRHIGMGPEVAFAGIFNDIPAGLVPECIGRGDNLTMGGVDEAVGLFL